MICQTYPECQGLTGVRGIRSGRWINHHNMGHKQMSLQNKFCVNYIELILLLTY